MQCAPPESLNLNQTKTMPDSGKDLRCFQAFMTWLAQQPYPAQADTLDDGGWEFLCEETQAAYEAWCAAWQHRIES